MISLILTDGEFYTLIVRTQVSVGNSVVFQKDNCEVE